MWAWDIFQLLLILSLIVYATNDDAATTEEDYTSDDRDNTENEEDYENNENTENTENEDEDCMLDYIVSVSDLCSHCIDSSWDSRWNYLAHPQQPIYVGP